MEVECHCSTRTEHLRICIEQGASAGLRTPKTHAYFAREMESIGVGVKKSPNRSRTMAISLKEQLRE